MLCYFHTPLKPLIITIANGSSPFEAREHDNILFVSDEGRVVVSKITLIGYQGTGGFRSPRYAREPGLIKAGHVGIQCDGDDRIIGLGERSFPLVRHYYLLLSWGYLDESLLNGTT